MAISEMLSDSPDKLHKRGQTGDSGWRRFSDRPRLLYRDFKELLALPQVSIDLMYSRTAKNDPFYANVVRDFYSYAMSRHPKLPIFRRLSHVAVCQFPPTFDGYFMSIEAAARRNYKKAQRNNYHFSTINFNEHLADIRRIRQSADYRQGKVPSELLDEEVTPVSNPPSLLPWHDYFYAGTLREGTLYAYAGCLVAGEACMLEHILGDAPRHADGVVPMLIISLAQHLQEQYPSVKYFIYGTYYGSREPMRRFKRKFLFTPHSVSWKL